MRYISYLMPIMRYLPHLITGLIIGLMLAQFSHAEECSQAITTETKEISAAVPAHLKGGYIVVVMPDGETTYHFEANDYKVVPRKKETLVTKETISCKVRSSETRPNRVSILGGQGPTGHLRSKSDGANAEVEAHQGLVLGAQYQRQVNERISIGVQVQDNESALSIIGYEF
jgi:hypothetical protein